MITKHILSKTQFVFNFVVVMRWNGLIWNFLSLPDLPCSTPFHTPALPGSFLSLNFSFSYLSLDGRTVDVKLAFFPCSPSQHAVQFHQITNKKYSLKYNVIINTIKIKI